jgi:DNA-binding MarR family transcriptional regulator
MDEVEQWPTGRLLSTAARLVEHHWDHHLARWDLNHAGVAVLHVLRDGPLAQRDLASRVRVREQTLSRTVQGLERRGYLIRDKDPRDRRRNLVEVTDSGRAVLEAVTDLGQAEHAFDVVAPQDLRAARRALIALLRQHAGRRWPPEEAGDGPSART